MLQLDRLILYYDFLFGLLGLVLSPSAFHNNTSSYGVAPVEEDNNLPFDYGVGPEGETFDYRTPEEKAYLRILLEPDVDSGGTQFDEGDEGTPVHKSSGRKQRRSHTNRKRNVNDTSLTASPASPPQSGTASRVANISKRTTQLRPASGLLAQHQ
jgi:hypothetical protein